MRWRLAAIAIDLALVAATLLASGWLVALSDGQLEDLYNNINDGQPVVGALATLKAIELWSARVLTVLGVASVGLGVVAVRRPSPTPRRDRWRPGRVVAAVGLIVSAASLAIEFVLHRFDLIAFPWSSYLLGYFWGINAEVGGTAILVAWLLMAVSGRWHAARGWRDGLGLALGGFWLVALAWQLMLPLTWIEPK